MGTRSANMENLLSATILFILDECLTKETMKRVIRPGRGLRPGFSAECCGCNGTKKLFLRRAGHCRLALDQCFMRRTRRRATRRRAGTWLPLPAVTREGCVGERRFDSGHPGR